MKAIIISFRRGKHTQKPRHFNIQLENITTKANALKFINKKIEWKSPAGKIIKGIITSTHGNKGLVRAVFEKGLPGQAVNTEAEIK